MKMVKPYTSEYQRVQLALLRAATEFDKVAAATKGNRVQSVGTLILQEFIAQEAQCPPPCRAGDGNQLEFPLDYCPLQYTDQIHSEAVNAYVEDLEEAISEGCNADEV